MKAEIEKLVNPLVDELSQTWKPVWGGTVYGQGARVWVPRVIPKGKTPFSPQLVAHEGYFMFVGPDWSVTVDWDPVLSKYRVYSQGVTTGEDLALFNRLLAGPWSVLLESWEEDEARRRRWPHSRKVGNDSPKRKVNVDEVEVADRGRKVGRSVSVRDAWGVGD